MKWTERLRPRARPHLIMVPKGTFAKNPVGSLVDVEHEEIPQTLEEWVEEKQFLWNRAEALQDGRIVKAVRPRRRRKRKQA